MSKFSLYIFLLFFSFSFGQKKKTKNIDYESSRVKLVKNFRSESLEKRILNFPFSHSSKIRIISYNLEYEGYYTPPPPPPNVKLDSIEMVNYYKNAKKSIVLKDVLNNNSEEGIIEIKTLDLKDISELTNIYYNTCSKYTFESQIGNKCFFPRNAILFYDKDDKVFAFTEICFQCEGTYSFPENIFRENEICEFIYPALEKFFKDRNIQTQSNRAINEKK